MNKFEITDLLNEKTKSDIKRIEVGYKELKENEKNIYRLNSIKELADDILNNGLLQDIVVVKNDNFYKIVIGHRRYNAIKYINEELNIAGFEKIKVKVLPEEEEFLTNLKLHSSNLLTRQVNAYEMLIAIQNLRQIKQVAKNRDKPLKGRTRDIIGNIVGLKGTQVQKYLLISEQAHNKMLEEIKEEKLSINDAYKILTSNDDVVEIKEPKKEKTQEEKFINQLNKMIKYAKKNNDMHLEERIKEVIVGINNHITLDLDWSDNE